MNLRWRKRPVVIEAMQLPPLDVDPSPELVVWLDSMDHHWESARDGCIIIRTLEGDMTAQPGDWIIKGVEGEMYPCKPDIFEKSYEPVVDIPDPPPAHEPWNA